MADKPPAYDYQQQGYQQQGYAAYQQQPPPGYQATSPVTVAVAQQPQTVHQTVIVERHVFRSRTSRCRIYLEGAI
jgi:hypothetical protein